MLAQLIRKALVLAAGLLVASVVVFTFMAVLPGDPAQVALGVNATPEAVREMHERFGTDRPLVVQYLDWAGGLLTGDFGRSYVTQELIAPYIADRFQVTLWLVLTAIAVALVIALPLGVVSAVRHRGIGGMALSGLSQVGVAVPNFLAGLLLIALFAVQLRLLPSGGWTPPIEDPVAFVRQLILPAVSLGLVQAAILTRYVRSAVLDVLREDHLRTARAKGLTPYRALVRHGLRNAAIPVVTVLALQLATLLVGAVVIERVFVIPGLGSLLLDGVANRDLLLVQGVVMVLVAAVLLINFAVDVLYTVLDPRMRRAH
ncbi:peptide/nickel transport system permease protein [Spinactinospora alkalitolerans]|uniref:Peptide/nickel transport system permease protein n=1 Tax=Spinactinospora alkalitolerans TaxID=687207 RepID=A0A852TSD4_9ACTN|nr:ABC transporter permease [Spinactinospora alkalitolerans]NYE46929.1 peptide/nickel transport system permease protein [Spinactinospora alkalitolerans]